MDEANALESCINKQVIFLPSQNYSQRRYKSDVLKSLNKAKYGTDDIKIDTLLLHYTSCFDLHTTNLFTKHNSVSSHYCVNTDGIIRNYVSESNRAWHAGIGYWTQNTDINTCSIGIEQIHLGYWQGHINSLKSCLNETYLSINNQIEIENKTNQEKSNTDNDDGNGIGVKWYNVIKEGISTMYNCLYMTYGIKTVQIDHSDKLWYIWDVNSELIKSTIELSKHLILKYKILPNNIIGHSDITSRKCDPGPLYPWKYLYDTAGIGAMPLTPNDTTMDNNNNNKVFELSPDLIKHESISYMQEQLDKYGYKINSKSGKLDDDTKNAIKAFRMHYYIDEGLLDKPTKNAMYAIGSLNYKYIETDEWKTDTKYEKLYLNRNNNNGNNNNTNAKTNEE